MAITPEPPNPVQPPNDPTAETPASIAPPIVIDAEPAVSIGLPNDPTAEPVGAIDAPNDPTEIPAAEIGVPNNPAEKSPQLIDPPIVHDAEPVGEIGLPTLPIAEPAVEISIPNDPTEIPAVEIGLPNSPTAESPVIIDAPTLPIAETPVDVAIPNDPTEIPAAEIGLPTLPISEPVGDISAPETPIPEPEGTIDPPENLVACGVTNIATWSEELDNPAWIKLQSSISANAIIAPDGELTADKIVEDLSAASLHEVNDTFTVEAGVVTMSCYGKTDGLRTEIRLEDRTESARITFDLITGQLINQTNAFNFVAIELSDGWWRFSASFNSTGGSKIFAFMPAVSGSVVYDGDGVSGIYVWGIQIENNPSVGCYVPTQGVPVTEGGVLPPNSPTSETIGDISIPNSPTEIPAAEIGIPNSPTSETIGDISIPNSPTEIPAAEIGVPNSPTAETIGDISTPETPTAEPVGELSPPENLVACGVTNIATWSEELDNPAWIKLQSSISVNAIIAPDGELTADKIVEDLSAASLHEVNDTFTVEAGIATMSCYGKTDGVRTQIRLEDRTESVRVTFDLITGALVGQTNAFNFVAIELADGWWRFSVSFNTTGGNKIFAFMPAVSGTVSYDGDGVSGIYVWGIQVENNPTLGCYVPTQGVPVTEGGVLPPSVLQAAEVPKHLPAVCPLVQMNFADEFYATFGNPVSFDEIFDYSRNTNATFINRRVGRNGGFEYFVDTDFVGDVENVAFFSEQFQNAVWEKTDATVSIESFTAPDGSKTAKKITEGTDSSVHRLLQTPVLPATGEGTIFCYVKAGERSQVYISNSGVGDAFGRFDLITGVVLEIGVNAKSAKIEPYPDGWWKCSVSFLVASPTNTFQIFISIPGLIDYQGDGVSGIYVWGAQATATGIPVPYVRTLSSAVTKTFAEKLRIEYDTKTGESLGALIEKGSNNLLLDSENFSTAGNWQNINSSVTLNQSLGPDLSFSADKMSNTVSAVGSHRLRNNVTVDDPDVLWTASVYVKKGTMRYIMLRKETDTEGGSTTFDLDNGTVVTGPGTIQKIGDYYRLAITDRADANLFFFEILQISNSLELLYAGTTNQFTYLWGAMVEKKESATAYIRTFDIKEIRTSDTLFSTIAMDSAVQITSKIAPSFNNNSDDMALNFGTDNDNAIAINNRTTQKARFTMLTGGVLLIDANSIEDWVDLKTIIAIFDQRDIRYYFGNELIFNSYDFPLNSYEIPAMKTLAIGIALSSGSRFLGHFKEVIVYDKITIENPVVEA